jgi:nucleoside-diphosphate-sugar epimerase
MGEKRAHTQYVALTGVVNNRRETHQLTNSPTHQLCGFCQSGAAGSSARTSRALERQGHDVVVFHRGTTSLPHEIVGDRRKLGDDASALRAAAPDVVVDLILSSGTQARELMRLFRGHTHRVVALSSCDVYRACGVLHGSEPGPLEPVPLDESSALRTKLQTYPPDRISDSCRS